MPQISVVMPVFNGAKHLKESIESVLAQTYTDWEILAVNEFGSDDGSAEIINEYVKKDKRIILVQNDVRLGLADSLNKGFKMAKSEYLARLDADDIAHPTRFQKQVEFLKSHQSVGIVGTYQHHFGENTDWVHTPPIEPDKIRAKLLFNCDMCHSTLMLRRDVVIKNSLFYDNQYLAEDYELWCRAVLVTDFATIPEVLGEYRWDGDNITVGKKKNLNIESGHLVARNIEQALGLKLLENQHIYFQNWDNPFGNLSSEEHARRLSEFEVILKQIYMANREKIYISDNDMLGLLATKWRWAKYFMPWNEQYDICCMDEIFDESYKPSFWIRYKRFCAQNKKFSTKIKKIVKRMLRPIVRPIKSRVDGKFACLESNICTLIEAKTRDINNDMHIRLAQSFEAMNEFYLDEICATKKSILNILQEQGIVLEEKFLMSMNELVGKSEENILKTLDGRIWKSEENVLRTIDDQIVKSEENILRTFDERIWKSEENILQTFDGRIWKSEENVLRTFDGRIWKAEENVLRTIDDRIVKSEENILRTFDGRIWKCEQKTVKAINERIWNMSYKMEKHFPQHSLTRQSDDYVYNEFFYDDNRYNSYMSAYHVFKKLLPTIKPKSICDFGCGTGTWLYVAQKFGVEKVAGLDGNYVDRDLLMIDVDDFIPSDLSQPTLLNQSFDLAISLEVAEHIDAKYADIFIDNICSSSKVIIFSAAHPGQGGDEHVNEQPFSYWEQKFEVRGYTYIEIRSLFELNQDICTWYRENIALFVKKDIAQQYNLKFMQLMGDIT